MERYSVSLTVRQARKVLEHMPESLDAPKNDPVRFPEESPFRIWVSLGSDICEPDEYLGISRQRYLNMEVVVDKIEIDSDGSVHLISRLVREPDGTVVFRRVDRYAINNEEHRTYIKYFAMDYLRYLSSRRQRHKIIYVPGEDVTFDIEMSGSTLGFIKCCLDDNY